MSKLSVGAWQKHINGSYPLIGFQKQPVMLNAEVGSENGGACGKLEAAESTWSTPEPGASKREQNVEMCVRNIYVILLLFIETLELCNHLVVSSRHSECFR